MRTKMLVHADIKEFLGDLSDAIEADQTYVDSLPRNRFHSQYDDGLWRDWRRDFREFLGKLSATVDTMSAASLQRLNEVASSFEPTVVGQIMLETLAEIVGGCSAAGCETAEHFFDWVTGEVVRQGRGKRSNGSLRMAMSQWFPANDPLTIALDPECGYPVRGSRARTPRVRPAT
ncbi:hypothetical protein [uncultured Bradyrhizobium sp.]|uniref:hypothetical protein n=1 Tax=uncultured Bradyrhizobium sp. TaxID=199684 RepID=UPI0026118C81|nr:hypothetical protein [uncultured Bradyrhizobium sp.]